nr:uncharacterized protein LOC124818272 [Hydra vulgaris]
MKDVISLEKEVVSLYSKTNILKEENLELQKLVSLLDDDEVITFEDGRYSDDIRETIMKLLSMNVSTNSVNEVIKVVLNKLAKKNISRLPSAAVKCRLMQEASILGQFQVAEAMLENNLINKNSKIGNCLLGDGTQKYHKHYQNFQITTTSGKTLSFGLSEVVGKDAATVLQNFTNIVDDICDVFVNGKIFEDTNLLHQDVVYTKLFECTQNDEFDSLTVHSLEIIFHAILVILERQCADQLPGGKYWNPSNSVSEAASNVPVTNKASESDFAILDLMFRTKPNANVQTIQALTMWSQNQIFEWLNGKSDEERKQLLEYSRTKVTLMKSKYDERKEALKKDKAMHLLAKQEEKNREEIKLQHKKVAACNDLINLNVRAWISLEEAEKTVFNIEVFCKTKVEGSKRINLSSEELYQNLLIVIQANLTPNKQSLSNNISNNLKPRTLRDAAVEDKKKELMEKIQDERLNKLIEQQKKHSLSKFINNPSDFVGFSIQHRVREEDAHEVSWERAQVVQIDQLNGRRTTYLVKYDNEPDEVWSFPLLIDFEKGDLILCS